jgi:hypothetical protein
MVGIEMIYSTKSPAFSPALGRLLMGALLFLACTCDLLYSPKNQPQPFSSSTHDTASISHLFSVNPGRQICNPSASQDTVNFKGCMLFLNLEGALKLNVPQKWKSEYPLEATIAHDRLTIVDSSNTVRWFMMKPSFIPQSELQDPEWSTHPDYIAFLGDNDNNSDGYIVRISDKNVLKMNNGLLQANSTPHVWLPDRFQSTVNVNLDAAPVLFTTPVSAWDSTSGMVDKETIRAYFGTDSVKFVYSKNKGSQGLTIYYLDFHEQHPRIREVPRPRGKDGNDCESPLISPNGNWIVYNCKNGSLACEAYLQCLSDSSEPVPLHSGMAAEPHWWLSNAGSLFVLYSTKVGPLSGLLEKVPSDGSYGETLIRRVAIGPQWLSLYDPESRLAPLPFQGGLTRDGKYLVTGYIYGYILGYPWIGM